MAEDSVTKALNAAKSAIGSATRFTQTVEGNPASSFAPPKPEPPKIPQAKRPSYSLASQARSLMSGQGDTAEGLKARQENIQQYLKANPQ
jgi:hypothetical protein